MSKISQEHPELKYLYDKYIANELSEKEFNTLFDAFSEPDKEALLAQLMTDTWHSTSPLPTFMYNEPDILPSTSRIHFLKRNWLRYAAAIILLAGTGAYIWSAKSKSAAELAGKETPSIPKIDIAPGANKAILTLADGSTIVLDAAPNDTLAQQGNVNILKTEEGQLSYYIPTNETITSAPLFNTITTPRGGKYRITLPDGSKVWLNAASSIRFPSAFTGEERNVHITGEAYFEIATDSKRPFIVKSKDIDVQVLGTSFNMNVYEDELFNKTTLVSGTVKVVAGNNSRLLQPGQQAIINDLNDAKIKVVSADLEQACGWKNELFVFKNTNIKDIMRELARWYDVEVSYKGNMSDENFTGKIPRNQNLARVVEKLQETNSLNFKMNGKQILVTQ